jgi:hypothetical protein
MFMKMINHRYKLVCWSFKTFRKIFCCYYLFLLSMQGLSCLMVSASPVQYIKLGGSSPFYLHLSELSWSLRTIFHSQATIRMCAPFLNLHRIYGEKNQTVRSVFFALSLGRLTLNTWGTLGYTLQKAQ